MVFAVGLGYEDGMGGRLVGGKRSTARELGRLIGSHAGGRLADYCNTYMKHRAQEGEVVDHDRLCSHAASWVSSLPPRYIEEMQGIADGAHMSADLLFAWAYFEACLEGACTGFVLQHGGDLWVGRNNDTFVPEVWGYATHREVPGWIPSLAFGLLGDPFVTTGFNKAGLWLHYNVTVHRGS